MLWLPLCISICKILKNMILVIFIRGNPVSIQISRFGMTDSMNEYMSWTKSILIGVLFIIRVLTFLTDCFSFRLHSTFIRSFMSEHNVWVWCWWRRIGKEWGGEIKSLLEFSIEFLESTGEEDMAPGSKMKDIAEPDGPWPAHRLLTSSSRTSPETSLC